MNMPKIAKKFHNQAKHTYTWFLLGSEHISKKGAKDRAIHERMLGNDARVVSVGKESYAVYIRRNKNRKEY